MAEHRKSAEIFAGFPRLLSSRDTVPAFIMSRPGTTLHEGALVARRAMRAHLVKAQQVALEHGALEQKLLDDVMPSRALPPHAGEPVRRFGSSSR
jgi:hypothetical protein